MPNPDPHRYDFLWKVSRMPYLTTSVWLHEEYRRRDFLITYYRNDWKTYIGKVERTRLSRKGLQLLRTGFRQYVRQVEAAVRAARLRDRREASVKLRTLSDRALRRHTLAFIRFNLSLWRTYFWTEYFCYDEVDRRIEARTSDWRELRRRVRVIQRLKFRFRRELNEAFYGRGVLVRMVEEAGRRLKRRSLDSFDYQEVAHALVGKPLPHVDRSAFVLGSFNGWKALTGSRARQIIRRFDSSLLSGSRTVLKGQVGNPGRYTGKVRIIPFDLEANYPKLIGRMRRGEVLVTGTTGPELILACKKAGAIVTEEGGIISHAAIVSRELGIPSVIGTKIATEVLKDGDRVEVNAHQGTVTLLPRKR